MPQSTSRPLLKRLKKTGLYIISVIGVLLISGMIYQVIVESNDRKKFAYPGKLILVDDHQMHILIKGKGSPVVVLEAASDGSSANWVWIMNEIAKVTTVCAYDRAGHGWSDPGKKPRDATHIADELHTLLLKADIHAPLILVGHSAGGLFIKEYQQEFPADVAGMVLVDADNEKEVSETAGFDKQLTDDKHFAENMAGLAMFGIPRLIFSMHEPAPELPELQGQQIRSFWSAAKHWKTLSLELEARLQTNQEVAEGSKQLHIPIEIISAGKQSADWLKLQHETENLSTVSHHTVIDSASHLALVLNENFATFTSAAIRRVIDSVRTGQK